MENSNSEKIITLKFLDNFYKASKKGCLSLDITTDRNLIAELLRDELIFKTAEGYFISTKGQELILNL